MISLQLFIALRATSNYVAKRQAFTRKDRIILLNRQDKSLYGPVIKTKKPKRSKKLSEPSAEHETVSTSSAASPSGPVIKTKKPKRSKKLSGHETVSTSSAPSPSDDAVVKKPETDYCSEMHWILRSSWRGIVDESHPKSGKGLLRIFENQTDKNVPSSAKELKTVNTKKLVEAEVLNTNEPAVIQKPIPLSNEELKNVLKYPLQSDVLTTPPTDIRAPELRTLPSVGRILQYTMPEAARNALLNWKLAKISELGEQGFAELQQANLSSGSTFHSSLQQYFLTNEIPIASSPVYKLWESVKGVLDTFTDMPVSVEKTVYHPILKYKGICDCVSEVDNQLTIIEWKKSGRSKPTLAATYDAPLQLCAYLGALNCTPEFQGRIRHGMVVVAYENGKQADVYKMNEVMLRKYWRVWSGRLHEFWVRSRDDTLPEPI